MFIAYKILFMSGYTCNMFAMSAMKGKNKNYALYIWVIYLPILYAININYLLQLVLSSELKKTTATDVIIIMLWQFWIFSATVQMYNVFFTDSYYFSVVYYMNVLWTNDIIILNCNSEHLLASNT
jgi:hypothetical protein